MCKTICTLGIAVLSFSLLLPVFPVSRAADSTQSPQTQSLQAQHVFDANVTIAEMLNFGKSKYGERRVIPITGGTFKSRSEEQAKRTTGSLASLLLANQVLSKE